MLSLLTQKPARVVGDCNFMGEGTSPPVSSVLVKLLARLSNHSLSCPSTLVSFTLHSSYQQHYETLTTTNQHLSTYPKIVI